MWTGSVASETSAGLRLCSGVGMPSARADPHGRLAATGHMQKRRAACMRLGILPLEWCLTRRAFQGGPKCVRRAAADRCRQLIPVTTIQLPDEIFERTLAQRRHSHAQAFGPDTCTGVQ